VYDLKLLEPFHGTRRHRQLVWWPIHPSRLSSGCLRRPTLVGKRRLVVLYSYTAAASCWSATWPLGLGQTEQPLQQSQEARPPPRLQNGLYHWRIPHTQLLTRTLQGRALRKSLFLKKTHFIPHCPLMSLHLFSASSTIQRADMFAALCAAGSWLGGLFTQVICLKIAYIVQHWWKSGGQ